MILAPELMVKAKIEEFFEGLKSDQSPIDDIFESYDASLITQVKNFFKKQKVKIALGYPREVADIPGIYVTVVTDNESNQFLGMYIEDVKVEDDEGNLINIKEKSGAAFSTIVRATIYSANADLTVYLYNILKYLLIRERRNLEEDGLNEQTVSGGDFEPSPEWFPEFVFNRAVALNCSHLSFLTEALPVVKEVDSTGTFN